ncbi:hypothetical protein MSG28_007562 [Choristoneura fumiferana]|uniref:Uncharacterized protein n=1 Tax=Choristoneura fumiferana TaxID=7141 RepID=A0ACC0JXK3_CHOFU|nr:hypothetical protein MSG28_007562 [Choristoneura fumiferana]
MDGELPDCHKPVISDNDMSAGWQCASCLASQGFVTNYTKISSASKSPTHVSGSTTPVKISSGSSSSKVTTPNINIISADKRLQIMKKKAAKQHEKKKHKVTLHCTSLILPNQQEEAVEIFTQATHYGNGSRPLLNDCFMKSHFNVVEIMLIFGVVTFDEELPEDILTGVVEPETWVGDLDADDIFGVVCDKTLGGKA